MIIGLAGHMGSGKDAAGKILSGYGFRRIALGDAVRHEAEESIRAGALPAALPHYIRTIVADMPPEEVWKKPTSDRCRRLLQWWGTEYRRSQDPLYWVRAVQRTIESIGGNWVVTDVRFPNEIEVIHEMGGVVWRIDRDVPGCGIPNHISERVEQLKIDTAVPNHGTLDELRATIERLVPATV